MVVLESCNAYLVTALESIRDVFRSEDNMRDIAAKALAKVGLP